MDRINYKGIEKNQPAYVDWVSGCCLLVKRDFFEECKGFDQRYFIYFEDVDLCRKARAMKKNVIFNPSFVIIHEGVHASRSKKGLIISILKNKLARYHLISWLKYIFKWKIDFLVKLKLFFWRLSLKNKNNLKLKYKLDFSRYENIYK